MSAMDQLIAYEDSVLAGSARLRGVHADAVSRGRAAVAQVQQRSGIDSDDEIDQKIARLYAEQLDEYASRVESLISAEADDAWQARAANLPDSDWHSILRTHGTVGAARLQSALDAARSRAERPDDLQRALAVAARRCVCGYAKSGALPKRLCHPCAHAANAAWVAEEKRLIGSSAALQAEFEPILDEAISDMAKARSILDEVRDMAESSVVMTTRRKLARANRRHRSEIARLDLSRWSELAELVKLSSMPVMRSQARRARRRLGMARLERRSEVGDAAGEARMTRN